MAATGSSKWWAFGGIALAVFAVGLDGTILNVALPTLAASLHASESNLVWFSAAYLLALPAAMLPAGALGDRYGRKRVMLGALAVFGLASVLCAYAGSPAAFIAARAVLGASGAGVTVMALSAMTVLFTEQERPRAVGIWATVNFLSLPLGPLVGGWLLTHCWWGWVFLINLPVVAVGLVIGLVLVPESRAPQRHRFDGVGATSFTLGLVGLTYGFVDAGERGWLTAPVIATLLGGALLLTGFVAHERRLSAGGREPLVDLALFRSRSFSWGTALAALTALAMIGMLFTLPQYFQGVLGTDAIGSGIRLLPLIGGLTVGAAIAEPAARRAGAKPIAAAGFVLLAAGLLVGSRTSVGSGELFLAGWTALVGAGLGVTLSTTASVALSRLPKERSGVGSAVMQALQEVGGPFGSAILGSIMLAVYRGNLDLHGVPAPVADAARTSIFSGVNAAQSIGSADLLGTVRASFVHGMSTALVVSAGIAVAGALLSLLFLPIGLSKAEMQQERSDRQLAEPAPARTTRDQESQYPAQTAGAGAQALH